MVYYVVSHHRHCGEPSQSKCLLSPSSTEILHVCGLVGSRCSDLRNEMWTLAVALNCWACWPGTGTQEKGTTRTVNLLSPRFFRFCQSFTSNFPFSFPSPSLPFPSPFDLSPALKMHFAFTPWVKLLFYTYPVDWKSWFVFSWHGFAWPLSRKFLAMKNISPKPHHGDKGTLDYKQTILFEFWYYFTRPNIDTQTLSHNY